MASADTQEAEFLAMVSQHQRLLHKVCRMYAADNEARKDLFQEMVLQLWRSYPGFKGQAKLSTWLYRIALNVALTQLRRNYRRPKQEASSAGLQVAEATPSLNPAQELLQAAIPQLSAAERALLTLYLEEVPTEEIAAVLGINEGNVRVKLTRLRDKLRLLINPTVHHGAG